MELVAVGVSYKCEPKAGASAITKSIAKFLNGASGGLGSAFSMVDGLDTAVGEISEAMSGITTKLSTLLQEKLIDFVDTGLMAAKNFIFNKITNPIAALAQSNSFMTTAFKPISGLFGAFGCLGSAINKALKGTIKKLLTNMVQRGFINPAECAVEDFIGSLTSKISSVMDSIVGPLLGPINNLFSIVGKGFGSIKGVLQGGLNILGKVGGLLSCADGGGAGCHKQTLYRLGVGSVKNESDEKKQNFITRAFDKGNKKLDNLIETLDEKTGNIDVPRIDPITKEPMEVTCNTGNILDCGLPRVEIFGGGGSGAAGDVILGKFIEELDEQVKTIKVIDEETKKESTFTSLIDDIKVTGSILGVDITYPGEGYTSEPLVSFVDNCDQGYGAYGRATIDKDPNSPTFGQLTGILMISEGENYPTGEEVDVFVDRIEVENGGSGYSLDDKIKDFEICGVDENGSITKVCPNDKAYRTLPPVNVESITGSGAILTPVMTTRRRQTGVTNVIDCITPRDGIVGYVDGKPYNGPFHLHPTRGVKMVGAVHLSTPHAIIYDTPQESLRSGGSPSSNVGGTKVGLRSIQQLVQESETETETTTPSTPTMDTYSDPVDESQNNTPPPTPPSSPPPSSPPPSSPPSSGSSGGGYGY
tara:strand:+ start:4822 stop:6756 length:1935 start_codon:yes stop_codon:yes gene_type:complete